MGTAPENHAQYVCLPLRAGGQIAQNMSLKAVRAATCGGGAPLRAPCVPRPRQA